LFCNTGSDIGFFALNTTAAGVAEALGNGVGVGVGDGVGVGVGVTAIGFESAMPLSQISFLPDLTQVNFFVVVVLTDPALVQAAPADGEAADAVF
jgi:hypothetical protein